MTSTREQMDMHREYMKRYQKQAAENVGESAQYKDYYQTLGLPRNATHAEIRAAYRALALRYHPDRNPSKEAEERWDGVPAAYAVLSNPNDRMEYDSSLEIRDALVLFYSTYNPAKLDQCTIQAVIDGWHGREVELFRMLHDKYEIAPHQGTKSATEQCSLIIPEEKSAAISKDHLASAEVTPRPVSFFETLRLMTSDLCCAAKAYYEVDSTSPGFIDMPRNTNTPGTSADPIAEAKKETNNVPEVPIVATNLTEINLEPSFAKAC